MIEVRGDIKRVHKGIMTSVDFLGCERSLSYILVAFCFFGNIFLMWSWWQIVVLIFTFVGFMIGRTLYKSDPYLLQVFFNNIAFEEEKYKYLAPRSNAKDITKKFKKESIRL